MNYNKALQIRLKDLIVTYKFFIKHKNYGTYCDLREQKRTIQLYVNNWRFSKMTKEDLRKEFNTHLIDQFEDDSAKTNYIKFLEEKVIQLNENLETFKEYFKMFC